MPFRDIAGHRPLVALLARSVARGSMPQSLLFAGPEGVGKRLAAIAAAQALNCLSPRATPVAQAFQACEGIDACGACTACTRIARGTHPDVVLLAPDDKGSIRIEAVRDVIDRAAYRPFEGRRRVVVIDDAHTLGVPAQNALLKTLEEPPPASVFVLVTSRPDALLATVLSRCQRLRFTALAPADIAAALVARGVPAGEAQAVAATADGSVARALDQHAGDVVQSRAVAGRVLADVAASRDGSGRLAAAKTLIARGAKDTIDREEFGSHLRAMASLLRDAALVSTQPEHEASTAGSAPALANADVRDSVERLARSFRGGRAVEAFAAVDRAIDALDRNGGVKVVADWLVMNL